jgi:hypothetical protein
MAALFKTLSGVTEFGIYEMSALKKLHSRSGEGYMLGCGLRPHPNIPVLFSRLAFFQWSHEIIIARV